MNDIRRRAIPEDLRKSRVALKLVQPMHRSIGAWQADAAKLQALAQRALASGRIEPRIASEAELLLDRIAAQKADLVRQTEELSADISAHGRVVDTIRALDSVAANLNRARGILDGMSKS